MFKRGIQMQSKSLEVAYKYLSDVYQRLGFEKLDNNLLKHFVLIRILEPASKIKSIELLRRYFGIEYKKTTVFRKLLSAVSFKDSAIGVAINYARKHFGFDFSLVFYDVTTLYFETNEHDEFRLNGFSKDNKINQPQILVGLMVNNIGFPVYYDTFKGNTFEGHTINYHLLIVFMALCLSRVMEQEKQQSIKKIVEELKDVWTITIKDEISGNQLKFNTN